MRVVRSTGPAQAERPSGSAEARPPDGVAGADAATRRRPRHRALLRDGILIALVAALLAAATVPFWQAPGSVFDEGIVLAYGARTLHGAIPGRDYETIYGPANPYVIAGAFAIAGTNLETERAVGVIYRALIVIGGSLLLLSVGRAAAVISAAVMIALFVPIFASGAIPPIAWMACALMALALVALSRDRRGLAVGAGLFAGAAFLMRPDFLPMLAAASLPLLIGTGVRIRAVLAGLIPAALLGLTEFVVVGPLRLSRTISDIRTLSPARHIPIKPIDSEVGRLLLITLIGAIAAVVISVIAERREGPAARPRTRPVLALALLALTLTPYAVSRIDYVHVLIPLLSASAAFVGAVSLAGGLARRRWPAQWSPIAGGALALGSMLLFAQTQLRDPLHWDANIVTGRSPAFAHQSVHDGGRDFSLPPPEAPAVQTIVNAAERERRGGARTLFVGPQDLRRTAVNDAFLYYVLDDLTPATRYIELDPLVALSRQSDLIDDLRRADLLILDRRWDSWDEPNDSRRYNSNAPNLVVRAHFCRVAEALPFVLLRRCR